MNFMSICATKNHVSDLNIDEMRPVFDPKCFHKSILADNHEEILAKGKHPFVENPDYNPYACMVLTEHDMEEFWSILGLEINASEPVNHPIGDVISAALALAKNNLASIDPSFASHTNHADFQNRVMTEEIYKILLGRMMKLIRLGIKNGATHLSVG